ncbi:MAG: GNAT family N-acetyltransferase [Geodermatophilaceae bacterium]
MLEPGLVLSAGLTSYFGVTLAQMVGNVLSGQPGFDNTGPLSQAFFWVAVPSHCIWGLGMGAAAGLVLSAAEGQGFAQMMRGLEIGRIQVAARAVGVGRAALEDSIRYAQERESFGLPIWKHLSILLLVNDEDAAASSAGQSALREVRAEIDRVDRQVVAGIAEREIWVRAAGKLKAMGPDVRDPDRVEKVIARVREIAADLGADPDVIERTYRSMVAAFIDLELGQQGFLDAPEIAPLSVADAGEVLTLQRAAYASEAQLYNDPSLPALVQTLPELVTELANSVGHKAIRGSRLAGAVRSVVDGDTLHIGRLTVAPDLQGIGLGTALLAAAEADAGPEVTSATLFTGHLSEGNLRLYERNGYVEERREQLKPGVTLVHLRKPLKPPLPT